MTPTRQTKRQASRRGEVSARLLYCLPKTFDTGCQFSERPILRGDSPFFVLPADAESVEKMREQVARALYAQQREESSLSKPYYSPTWHQLAKWKKQEWRDKAAACLAALNLSPSNP